MEADPTGAREKRGSEHTIHACPHKTRWKGSSQPGNLFAFNPIRL